MTSRGGVYLRPGTPFVLGPGEDKPRPYDRL